MNRGHERNGLAIGGRPLSALIKKCISTLFSPCLPLQVYISLSPCVCLLSPPHSLLLTPSLPLQPFLPNSSSLVLPCCLLHIHRPFLIPSLLLCSLHCCLFVFPPLCSSVLKSFHLSPPASCSAAGPHAPAEPPGPADKSIHHCN